MEAQLPLPQAPGPAPDAARTGMNYACEACRAAKVKCSGSFQKGICKRCLDSKRECIFKTGPRTRRRRQAKSTTTTSPTSQPSASQPAEQLPPPPGPSKTFTIDTPLEPQDELPDTFEFLQSTHQAILDALLPTDPTAPVDYTPEMRSRATPSLTNVSTPPSITTSMTSASQSSGTGRPMSSLSIQPQFNLDSAAQLLLEFKEQMLPNYPCLNLANEEDDGSGANQGDESTAAGSNRRAGKGNASAHEEMEKAKARAAVVRMSRSRPFVLLAILAASSGSRTLQGHTLYDEEFRKVLGLKFIAGGERNIELLAGLLVYVVWYPAHLRPKSKQVMQYVRMAADIVQDLELDQPPDDDDEEDVMVDGERIDAIRAYLATWYLVSNRTSHWFSPSLLKPTPWLTRGCAILESHPACPGDRVLPWLVRHQTLIEQAADLARGRKKPDGDDLHRAELLERGVSAQLAEWRGQVPEDVSESTTINLSTIFTNLFTTTAPLLKLMPAPRTLARAKRNRGTPNILNPSATLFDPFSSPLISARLAATIPILHTWFDTILALPRPTLMSLSANQWAHFVVAIVVAFRMSFPPPSNPGSPFSTPDPSLRNNIAFGTYLNRLCRLGLSETDDADPTPASARGMDVLTAVRVVLAEVKRKFDRRVAAEEEAAAAAMEMEITRSMQGCPMLDGSLDGYFPGAWDETFADPMSGAGVGVGGIGKGPGVAGGGMEGDAGFEDLWATMTTGWAQDGMDFGGMGEFGG